MAAITALVSKYQTKSGSRYRVRISNRRLRGKKTGYDRAGFKTRREAQAYAQEVRERVARQELGDIDLGHSFGELCDKYVEDACPHLNEADQSRRQKQIDRWRAWLGNETLVADISPAKIAKVLRTLTHEPARQAPRGSDPKEIPGKTLSPTTINRYRACLSAVFAFAVKDLHWADHNPVHATRTMKEPGGRTRYLEPDEISRLGKAVDATKGQLPLIFWLALTTGLRQGNILDAKWSALTFLKDGTATLSVPKTKNGEPLVVPIAYPKVVHLLRAAKLKAGGQAETIIQPVVPGKRHHRWRDDWEKALATAEIDDFRFHDLRHCFASYLAMQGLDGLQIADLTGHRSLAMVKRYSHLNPKSRQQNAAAAVMGMNLLQEQEQRA